MQQRLFNPITERSYAAAPCGLLTARESSQVREAVAIMQQRLAAKRSGKFMNCPADLKDFLLLKYGNHSNRSKEVFGALFFSAKNELIGDQILFQGSISCCPVYLRTIAGAILKHKAAALVIWHMHPSGDTTPSGEDMLLTKRIAKLGQLIDCRLHDHIILGSSAVSFSEIGIDFMPS